ncbi:hypothetical protein H0H81_000403 [Sphagnurus paluster]|uniref:Uncharacterized protein n=1 Tax=Sphagnurus paluster TaxID=117069 RepID=A0A9P7GHM3_9AGAR|nr:hypothetical protein H0H81_000403 [Sphagnurus paluster]
MGKRKADDREYAGNQKAKQRSRRSDLTRQERAKIRILWNNGMPQDAVANIVGCCTTSVHKVVHRMTFVNDQDDDWDHVEESFKAKYQALSRSMDEFGVMRRPYRRKDLTRKERAMGRILAAHGVRQRAIARQLDCTRGQVKLLHNETEDDSDEDWEHVDEAFRKKYLPLARNEEASEASESEIGESTRIPSVTSRRTAPTKKPQKKASIVYRESTSSPTLNAANNNKNQTIPPPSLEKSRVKDWVQRHQASALPVAGPSTQRQSTTSIEVDSKSEIDLLESAPKFPTLAHFLACELEHDLTALYEDLEAQDLGTSAKLLAFAGWAEKDLHEMLKEALPYATAAQRFMLVKGVKRYEHAR